MKRETPKLALAWTDGLKTKRYGTKTAAYYAIAKRLVVEKYPPMLANSYALGVVIDQLGPGWTEELVERRMRKMFDLFYSEAAEGYFDSTRWRRVVTRVARFLAFVDSKRTAAELLELRFGDDEDLKRAEAEFQSCERASVAFAERAREIRAFIAARSNR